jgi:hypothetical protein
MVVNNHPSWTALLRRGDVVALIVDIIILPIKVIMSTIKATTSPRRRSAVHDGWLFTTIVQPLQFNLPFVLYFFSLIIYMPNYNTNNDDSLDPSIWGKSTWDYFHYVTFGYPINPTSNDKCAYVRWCKSFGATLPCHTCRRSFKTILENPITKLSYDALRNKESLIKWGWMIHNEVNKKAHGSHISYRMFLENYKEALQSFGIVEEVEEEVKHDKDDRSRSRNKNKNRNNKHTCSVCGLKKYDE